MSYILTYVRVALATLDVQSIFETPATDEIHTKDGKYGLAWTKPNNGLNNTQHNQQPCVWRATFDSSGIKTIKVGINLNISLQKHKLDQVAARNIRISLDKRIAFLK